MTRQGTSRTAAGRDTRPRRRPGTERRRNVEPGPRRVWATPATLAPRQGLHQEGLRTMAARKCPRRHGPGPHLPRELRPGFREIPQPADGCPHGTSGSVALLPRGATLDSLSWAESSNTRRRCQLSNLGTLGAMPRSLLNTSSRRCLSFGGQGPQELAPSEAWRIALTSRPTLRSSMSVGLAEADEFLVGEAGSESERLLAVGAKPADVGQTGEESWARPGRSGGAGQRRSPPPGSTSRPSRTPPEQQDPVRRARKETQGPVEPPPTRPDSRATVTPRT